MKELTEKLNKLYRQSSVDWIEECEGFIIYTIPRTWMFDSPTGTHNGYIVLPKDHIWVKQYCTNDYNDCDAPMHGGVTFGVEFEEDKFILGFDTAHCDDDSSLDHEWTIEHLRCIAKWATSAKSKEGYDHNNYSNTFDYYENDKHLVTIGTELIQFMCQMDYTAEDLLNFINKQKELLPYDDFSEYKDVLKIVTIPPKPLN